jgi:FkbM family methyltransferase
MTQKSPDIAQKRSIARRYLGFFGKPWKQQKQSIAFRYLRWIPHAMIPVRLPTGVWWLAENDFIGSALLWEGFENTEYELARKLVQSGMAVLDIGAHKGFYTLLFSRTVGASGRVLAFEPSHRERTRLNSHLCLNRCHNVSVFDWALGQKDEEGILFVAQGTDTGLNSLRPPDGGVPTHSETVRIRSLDSVLAEANVSHVDFIKIDVEGAELSVFSGAHRLLSTTPRPMILAEVSDVRTKQWGYKAQDTLALLEQCKFTWSRILPG